MKIHILLYTLATIASMDLVQAQFPSVLVRAEITENSPKFGNYLTYTQKIPMKAGELVIVLGKPKRGMRECYRRFIPKLIPKQGVTENSDKWIESRGSVFLLPGMAPRQARAVPGKGGGSFTFTMNPSDETTWHIASVDGVLEVQMRSTRPTPLFFLMGKTKVGPPVTFKEGYIERNAPLIRNRLRYQEHSLSDNAGKSLIVELRLPDTSDPKLTQHTLGVSTPSGQKLYTDSAFDNCARALVASMDKGDYTIQVQDTKFKDSVPIEKLDRPRYIVSTRSCPDLLKLLGITFMPNP